MNDFLMVLECIDKLSIGLNSNDFYNFLKKFDFSNEQEKDIKQQIEEEKYKARLILQSQEWANAIYKAEKHWYLDGQIDFLLAYANNDLDSFNNYFKAFDIIFPKQPKDNEQAIKFRQALLTKGLR